MGTYITTESTLELQWKIVINTWLKKVMKIINCDYQYEILEGQKLNKR